MQQPYLEVTYRHGRLLAAYYYLPREPRAKATRTSRVEPGLVIDYVDEQPIGIEITAPRELTLDRFNEVLSQLGQPPIGQTDFSPLQAA